jgi:Glutathione S-transferase, N-terminal domain
MRRTPMPPPLTPAQIVALGPLAPLPVALRRALSGEGFSPLPAPGESDWLANHPERGQTFADFVASRRVVPDAARRTLCLLPLGDIAPAQEVLRDALAAFYALPARLLPPVALAALEARSRVNDRSGKRQLFTPHILAALKRRLPDDALALAALTGEDLYPDEAWNFVYEHDTRSIFGDFDSIRQCNPLGRIPSLVLDSGETLIDSAAILDWLDEEVGPARALLPRAGAGANYPRGLTAEGDWSLATRPRDRVS